MGVLPATQQAGVGRIRQTRIKACEDIHKLQQPFSPAARLLTNQLGDILGDVHLDACCNN
jgi:hypothetical protein